MSARSLAARFTSVVMVLLGRTPKVYEPSEADIQVSIPQRRHDLLAEVLLDAVLTEGEQESARDAALRAPRDG